MMEYKIYNRGPKRLVTLFNKVILVEKNWLSEMLFYDTTVLGTD